MKKRMSQLIWAYNSRDRYRNLFLTALIFSLIIHVSTMIAFPQFSFLNYGQPDSVSDGSFVVINILEEESVLKPVMHVVKLASAVTASESKGSEDAASLANNSGSGALAQAVLLKGLAFADSLANRTMITFAPTASSRKKAIGSGTDLDIGFTNPTEAYTKNGYTGVRRGIGSIGPAGPGCAGP